MSTENFLASLISQVTPEWSFLPTLFSFKLCDKVKLNLVHSAQQEYKIWENTATTNYLQSHSNPQSNIGKQNTKHFSLFQSAFHSPKYSFLHYV